MRTFIKLPSHRQRDRAVNVLGFKFGFYSMSRGLHYGCFRVSQNEIAALKLAGVGFSRLKGPWDDIRPCMSERWLNRKTVQSKQ